MSSNPQPATPKDETRRIAGVIVTHGHLAGELLAAAEMIVGPISFITAVSIGWHDDVDAARDEVQRAITRVSQGAGVLLLTDMFGGTPTNIASMFLDDGNIEVVTGVNLPMVIKLASQTTKRATGRNGAPRLRSGATGHLSRRRSAGTVWESQSKIMIERTLMIKARLGLHARAAAKLVRVASGYESQVQLRRVDSNASADAKSILSVLMLAASHGTALQARAEGVDEEAAITAIEQLFADGFGELEPESAVKEAIKEIRCKGLGVSEGIVIGQVLRMHDGTQHVYHWRLGDAEVEAELAAFSGCS